VNQTPSKDVLSSIRHATSDLVAFVGTFFLCLVTLIVVRTFVLDPEWGTPLPIAERLSYRIATALFVGLTGVVARLFHKTWRVVLYGSLGPFLAYLLWAFEKQNLFVNPELWKLFERGWFNVAVACGLFGLLFVSLAHIWASRYKL
jgi:hypothetical protein